MPRRNTPKRNERLRRRQGGGLDGAKMMARLRRDTSHTPAVGRAMQEARRRAAPDD